MAFERLLAYINREYGLTIDERRREMLESRLQKRVRHYQLADVQDYTRMLLEEGHLGKELTELVNLVTTRTTSFFRENQHFQYLEDYFLPELVREKGAQQIKCWSVAGSSGQESYTLAIVIENFAENQDIAINYKIVATDVSDHALQDIRNGVYRRADADPIPLELRKKYLQQSKDKKFVRVHPRLKSKVEAVHLNLMANTYPDVPKNQDLVILRNCLIYFSKDDQGKIIRKVLTHLRRGGIFMVGHSEGIPNYRDYGLELETSATYRKK